MNDMPGRPLASGGTGELPGKRVLAVAVAAGLGLLLAGGFLAPPARSVSADSVTDRKQSLDRQIDELRETLEGTAKSLVDAAVDLKRAQSELVDANAKLDTARAALAEAAAQDRVLADRLAVAEAAVAKADRELRARQQQEADTRSRLGRLARETYAGSRLSGLAIALNAENPDQFADRVSVAGTALRQQNRAIARIQVQQAETRARQSRLAAAQSEVAELKQESEVLLGRHRAAEAEADAAATEVAGLVALQARAVQTIAARKSAEKKRIAALQAQQDKLARLLRDRARAKHRSSGGGTESAPSNGSGRLSYPVSAPVTSGFGYRYHPILHYSRLHAGTDFGAGCGTPIRAAAPGTVVRAGAAGGYGNQLVIDHGTMRGKNLATSYNHLSRFVVRSGTVSRGQLVAYSGTTGLSTGCHLHFEVYVNGTHVNPMDWF